MSEFMLSPQKDVLIIYKDILVWVVKYHLLILTSVCPLKYLETSQPFVLENDEAGVPHLEGSGLPAVISAGILLRGNQ